LIFVDASVWIDYFRGDINPATDFLDGLLSKEQAVAGDITLTEVLQGFASEREFAIASRLLARVPVVIIGGRELCLQAAANYRLLRARGLTVRKTIDTLIATRCIVDGLTLLHRDRDFDVFAENLGLLVVGPQ
jgi:hypothetical protein